MRFKGQFSLLRVDLEASKAAIHRRMMEALTHVAFAWVDAAQEPVPVWTGASKATFLHLAHAIGFQITIVPSPTAPSDSTGLGLARSEGQLGPIDPATGQYFFTYATTLDHLIENEQINANQVLGLRLKNPGPYEFQQRGLEAFQKAVQDVQLPAPVFTVERIKV